jgi:hypothetical protein
MIYLIIRTKIQDFNEHYLGRRKELRKRNKESILFSLTTQMIQIMTKYMFPIEWPTSYDNYSGNQEDSSRISNYW